jgi:hypothetical protein
MQRISSHVKSENDFLIQRNKTKLVLIAVIVNRFHDCTQLDLLLDENNFPCREVDTGFLALQLIKSVNNQLLFGLYSAKIAFTVHFGID